MDEPSAPLVVVILFYDIDRLLYFRKERLSGFPHSKDGCFQVIYSRGVEFENTAFVKEPDIQIWMMLFASKMMKSLCMQLPFGTGKKNKSLIWVYK